MMRAVDGRTVGHREDGAMAVSEQTLDREDARRLPRPGRRFFAFVVTAALGAAAVVGGLALLYQRDAGRILPGISAAGIDLGGLTADEARATLTARLADLSAGSIVVRSGLGATTLSFTDIGRVPDIDAMVADATSVGRGGSWLDETIAAIRLQLKPEALGLRLGYDHDRAAATLTSFADRMALRAIDASVIRGTGGFAVIVGVDGRRIDAAAALAEVDRLMADPATRAGAIVVAPVTRVAPDLTDAAAEEVRLAASRMATPLTVSSGSSTWVLRVSQLRPWISFGWVDGVYRPILDRTKIPGFLASIAKKVARPVRDAEFLRDKRGRIVGSMADRAGRALDVPASADAIAAAIEGRAALAPATPIELAVATIPPKRTTEEAAKTAPLMVKVGSWTTHYQVAAHNGFGANITVPTRVLNGTVVAPGAVFDFWASLGEVSLRTGYKLGGAIVGGHSVEGKALAGGICAASTTLFNAALRGGFEIQRRQPHWYYITRYPLGLDATVSGTQTMRFRNDTQYPILIRGFASPGFVRYEIWSVPNGRTVALSRPHVTNVVPGSDSTVDAPDLPKGTSERIEWPVDGKDVVVTRTVRDAAGHVIHQDTFVSHYHRMIGINRIGIG
jgi:vancomycin resistance protein YoaR